MKIPKACLLAFVGKKYQDRKDVLTVVGVGRDGTLKAIINPKYVRKYK